MKEEKLRYQTYKDDVEDLIPCYATTVPAHLSDGSLRSLVEERAMRGLPANLNLPILQNFFKYVYPQLPVVDMNSLLDAVKGGQSHHRISLFLWQAVTASSIVFLTKSEQLSAGYDNRYKATDVFLKRAMKLHQHHYEKDDMTILQGLLLLCYSPSEDSITRHNQLECAKQVTTQAKWLRSMMSKCGAAKRQLWRRLWFCAYILEREQVFRHVTNRDSSFELHASGIAPLSLTDFDVQPLYTLGHNGNVVEFPPSYQIFRAIRLASFSVQKVRLFMELEQDDQSPAGLTRPSSFGAIIPSDTDFWKAQSVITTFEEWQTTTNCTERVMIRDGHSDSSMFVHWASLNLLFYSIVLSMLMSAVRHIAETGQHGRQGLISKVLREELIESCILKILRILQLTGTSQDLFFLHHINHAAATSITTTHEILAKSYATEPKKGDKKYKISPVVSLVYKRLMHAYIQQTLHGPTISPIPGFHWPALYRSGATSSNRATTLKLYIRVTDSGLISTDSELAAHAPNEKLPAPRGDTIEQWSADVLNMESIIFAPKEAVFSIAHKPLPTAFSMSQDP